MILDTNALSAFADGDPLIHPIVEQAPVVALPVIVLGEYRYGISQSRSRRRYEQWLEEWLGGFEMLKVDERTTIAYAEIRSRLKQKGRPIPANDLWIAALVKQHEQPLLSRDTHFDYVPGLERVDW